VLTTLRRAEYAELIGLFFLQGAALGMWFVPLSSVLEAHGLAHIRPYAFATSGVAAFVSPLLFGAMADRHASPVKVLRWLALATAIAMAAASTAIRQGASPWVVLGLILLHAFCSSPTWSIASTIVFARLGDAKKEFGPIRAMATIGWMGGCLAVSDAWIRFSVTPRPNRSRAISSTAVVAPRTRSSFHLIFSPIAPSWRIPRAWSMGSRPCQPLPAHAVTPPASRRLNPNSDQPSPPSRGPRPRYIARKKTNTAAMAADNPLQNTVHRVCPSVVQTANHPPVLR